MKVKSVSFSKGAIRTLSQLSRNISERIRAKIRQYATDPRSLANKVKALKGYDNVLRLRVGEWRVIFTDDAEIIAIINVAPRGSVYD